MPFFLSLFVFLCGTSWFIYGLLGRDPFVAVSSTLTLSTFISFQLDQYNTNTKCHYLNIPYCIAIGLYLFINLQLDKLNTMQIVTI